MARKKKKKAKKPAIPADLVASKAKKLIANATPMMDWFARIMFKKDPALVQHVIQVATGDPSIQIRSFHVQEDFGFLGVRGYSFDVYAVGTDRTMYDAEIQNKFKDFPPKRGRLHAAVMDVAALEKGSQYSDLPRSYVIVFFDHDPFGCGCPLYHIERTVKETGEGYGDEQTIIYLNGDYRGDDAVGKLIQSFHCSDPDDMKDETVRRRAAYLKSTEGGNKEMEPQLKEFIDLAAKHQTIELQEELVEKDKQLHERDKQLHEQEEEIARLKQQVKELGGQVVFSCNPQKKEVRKWSLN